jgi:hypothetical protein|tara:strand:+ start:15371 stop:15628 length:258 start_codon:yes stop_codon:yes gene_type:complete
VWPQIFIEFQWSTEMQTDEKYNVGVPCEDALAAIGDIANSGSLLQKVLATGVASNRVAEACVNLFTEIAELAGAAVDSAKPGSDT